jgi:hypothetical protein
MASASDSRRPIWAPSAQADAQLEANARAIDAFDQALADEFEFDV